MKEQHYKNHRQIVPLYHGLTLLAIIAGWVLVIIDILRDNHGNRLTQFLFLLVFIVATSLYYHSRTFALKAQDRAIRAEENLRHTLLTGKPLDGRLTLNQIIALRFASDEEYPALSQRAAEEGLSGREIKKLVKNWRSDTHRV
jgi:hypothetical protein